MASPLYATGMRLLEGLWIRVMDVGFKQGELIVRDGSHSNGRITQLPKNLTLLLGGHLAYVKMRHARHLADGLAGCQGDCVKQRFYKVVVVYLARRKDLAFIKVAGRIKFPVGTPVVRAAQAFAVYGNYLPCQREVLLLHPAYELASKPFASTAKRPG